MPIMLFTNGLRFCTVLKGGNRVDKSVLAREWGCNPKDIPYFECAINEDGQLVPSSENQKQFEHPKWGVRTLEKWEAIKYAAAAEAVKLQQAAAAAAAPLASTGEAASAPLALTGKAAEAQVAALKARVFDLEMSNHYVANAHVGSMERIAELERQVGQLSEANSEYAVSYEKLQKANAELRGQVEQLASTNAELRKQAAQAASVVGASGASQATVGEAPLPPAPVATVTNPTPAESAALHRLPKLPELRL